MTPSETRGSLRFPSSLPGTLLSRWLAFVYPASARILSPPWTAAAPSASRAVRNHPGSRFLPLSGVRVRCITIGSVPWTR